MKNKHLQHPLSHAFSLIARLRHIFIVLHLFMCQNLSAQAPCRQHDSLELVRLYQATNGANWFSGYRWDLSKPINTWFGIALETSGCVSKISLNDVGIAGSLPNLDLPNLTYLSLGSNRLTGTIPNFDLPNLTYLNLGSNRLTGSLPNLNLPNLVECILYYNELSGNIPNFNLPNLKILHLSSNQLSRTIPTLNLPNLTLLNVGFNQLSGAIPNFNMPNLTYLSLINNQLSGAIPNFNMPRLQYMYLQTNQLSGAIPNFNLPNLLVLSLNNNALIGSIPNFNLPAVGLVYLNFNQLSGTIPALNLPNISTFDARNNQLTGQLPNFKFPIIRILALQNNQLSGSLPNFNFPTISAIDLSNNQLSGCIPPSFKGFCRLEPYSINLHNNPNLSTTNMAAFCSSISTGMCPTVTSSCRYQDSLELVRLYMTTNGANWTINWNLWALMDTWHGVRLNANGCVSNLSLNNNNLKGIIPALELAQATSIDLSGNQLKGTIPDFKCPNLTTLNLSNNQLSGCVPLSLKAFCGKAVNLSQNSALEPADFATFCASTDTVACPPPPYNCRFQDSLQLVSLYQAAGGAHTEGAWDLTKPMTTWLGVVLTAEGCVDSIFNPTYVQRNGRLPKLDLPNLRYFSIDARKLYGTVPNFNFPKIEYLAIYNAGQLSGELPPFNFPKIRYLSIQNSQISGTIPNFNCPQLEKLYLSFNQLSGTIPNFNLPNLKELELNRNKLTGSINHLNLPNLTRLALFGNQLSGGLPSFNLLPKLAHIELSHNNFTGTIPAYNLRDFPNLVSMYLDNNQLSGCVPPSIKAFCGKISFNYNPNLAVQFVQDFCGISSIGQCDTTTIKPDLTLENLHILTPSVQKGQILNFRFDAKNLGQGNATGSFTIKSYLSTDPILDNNDYQDGVVPTGNYPSGSLITQIQGAMLVKELVAAGTYYLILKIDADNQVLESNETNNIIVSTVTLTLTSPPLSSGCFSNFNIQGLDSSLPPNCLPNANTDARFFSSYHFGSLQMYGNRIADGFMATVTNGSTRPRVSTFFATSPPTTTPPVGARFADCANANWLYFTVNGVARIGEDLYVDSNAFIRVHYWGAETNPDYVYIQVDSANRMSLSNFLSRRKTENCNPCFKDDRTPPTFNCPDSTLIFKGYTNPGMSTSSLLSSIGVKATDNCGNDKLFLGANTFYNIKKGFTYPIHLIAYDSAGNKAACDFRLKIGCPETVPLFTKCPIDTVITAAVGQTCRNYTWLKPEVSYYFGEPVKVTNNFNPGDCFPIGTTKVVYTVVDSCQGTSTCTFTIQVKSAETTAEDIAVSMTATPSVYRRYSTHNFKITAKNNGTSAFTNVKIKFTRPENTVNGGTKIASVGTFQDYCVGGIECSEWTIPSLASGTTATLDAPIYILTPTGTITASANLLSSTPTDNVSANNTANLLISPSTLPTLAPANATLTAHKPTSALPIVIQKLNPTVTETEINVEIESLMDKKLELSISNAIGQTVLVQQTAIHKGMNTLRFDVGHLPQGLYFIQTNEGQGRGVPTKFIKF